MAPPTDEEIAKFNSASDIVKAEVNSLVAQINARYDFSNNESFLESVTSNDVQLFPTRAMCATAELIKSHCAKLALFVTAEQFPCSLVLKELEFIKQAISPLLSALASCNPQQYTTHYKRELCYHWRLNLGQLQEFLASLPQNQEDFETVGTMASNRADLPCVKAFNILSRNCDQIVKLCSGTIQECLSAQVNVWKDLIDDAKSELKIFKEENDSWNPDDDKEEEVPTSPDDVNDPQWQLDQLMAVENIPKDRTDILNQLEPCIARLGLFSILFKAIATRRLKPLPELPAANGDTQTLEVVARVNKLLRVLYKLHLGISNLLDAFYDHDAVALETNRAECFSSARLICELMHKPWHGERDGFSDWLDKFKAQLNVPDNVLQLQGSV